MFAKLLKHEFKNTRGTLGLLTIICLGVAVVAALALKAMIVSDAGAPYTDGYAVLMLIATPLLIMSFLAISVYAVASLLILYVRFFKNKFTDEGYLTFTLPTNVHTIYLSSLVNIIIWEIISLLTVFVSLAIIILFGTSPDKFLNTDIFHLDFGEFGLFLEMAFVDVTWNAMDTVQLILQYIISVISSLILATTCITIGATVAKKHKALAAIGIYFGLNYVVSGITSVLTIQTSLGASSLDGLMNTTSLMTTVINLAIIVGGYFLTTHFMKNKLNLP